MSGAAASVANLLYTEILFAFICDLAILGHKAKWTSIFGAAVIIFGSIASGGWPAGRRWWLFLLAHIPPPTLPPLLLLFSRPQAISREMGQSLSRMRHRSRLRSEIS